MASNTHIKKFQELDENEQKTVAHIINILKPKSDIIELQKNILEKDLVPVEDENRLRLLDKIARAYMGEDVSFGSRKKSSKAPREKLEENSISFDL